MLANNIRKVGVIGTGVIGSSWTGLFLANGLEVLVSDPALGAKEKLQAHLESIWPTLEQIGLSPGASLSNYKFVGASLKGHYNEVEFIQENAPEKLSVKESLFAEIDAETRPEVIVASSSSGLPSSRFISQCKKSPGRILIGHPFNPPHLMPLVEVVPHPGTDAEVVRRAQDFYARMGKRPVLINKETPGFAANRLQAALVNEAYSLVSRGILSAEDLDACISTSLGPRWALTGPFMSNVMGGGGGRDGFKHLLTHIGPGMKVWLDDMRQHTFDLNEASLEQLDKSVQEMLKHHDAEEVEKERDEVMIKLLKLKKEKPDLD